MGQRRELAVVRIGAAEVGQGSTTVLAQIAATALDVEVACVDVDAHGAPVYRSLPAPDSETKLRWLFRAAEAGPPWPYGGLSA